MMLNVHFKIVFVLLWCNLENIDGVVYERNRELRYIDISSKLIHVVRSAIECCLLCHNNKNCRVASYHKTNKICAIGTRTPIKDVYLVSDPGWDMLTLAVTCAPGWTKIKTACYKLSTRHDDWHDAETRCGSLHSGAHLADIHSKAINDLLKVLYFQEKGTLQFIWVGGFRHPEGMHKWWDLSLVSDSFTYWGTGQPDFQRGREYCMAVNAYDNFYWNDYECLYSTYGFCEY